MSHSDTDKIQAYNIKVKYPDDYMQRLIDEFGVDRHKAKRLWQAGEHIIRNKEVSELKNDIMNLANVPDIDICQVFQDDMENSPNDIKIFIMSDLHIPYQHEPSLNIAQQVFDVVKPDKTIFNGDCMDFNILSRFPHTSHVDINEPAEAPKAFYGVYQYFRSKWNYYLIGNHEFRVPRSLFRDNPQFASMILGLYKLQFRNMGLQFGGFKASQIYYSNLIKVFHGKATGDYAAKKNIENSCYGFHLSVCGHGHRPQESIKTSEAGMYTSVMTGCMCDIYPHYSDDESHPENWRQTFLVAHINKATHSINFEHIHIQKENRGNRHYAIFNGNIIWG